MRKPKKQIFPSDMGESGQAFMKQKTLVFDKIKNSEYFLPNIDNQTTNVEAVHSIILMPVYGH